MASLLDGLRQRIADLLRDLAARPLSLFCLLLAANAIALPYRNFVHDANLYGVQVLNRVDPGHFAGDLYFEYGSQDRFSLFSLVAAPAVAQLGLPAAFAVLYFLSNALFLLALQRFVRALVNDPVLSTLALLFLAMTEIPFGGLRIFHVNEPFLTPRIAANALVLFGLERLLAGRTGAAWLFVLLALPLHPLMAFPGVLILSAWLAVTHLRSKSLLVLLSMAALAATALLLQRSLAFRLFGHMDDAWRSSIHRVNPYHFPFEWTVEDWVRVVLSLTIALTAACNLSAGTPVRRLLLIMTGVAMVGLAGGILVCFLPYALPLQGQPWRWLWPLELVLYPLGFLTAYRLWTTQQGTARIAALGLLIYLNGDTWDRSFLWLLVLSAALFGAIVWRGLSIQPRVPDWAVRAALFTFALTSLLWTAFGLFGLMVLLRQQLGSLLEPIQLLMVLPTLIDPWCRLALLLGALVLLARFALPGWRLMTACSAVWATACLVFFVLPQTRSYADYRGLHDADERFVAEYLTRFEEPASTPTIFWPSRNLAFIWLQLRANVYFEFPHQIAGNLFSTGTAREGDRRAQLVKRFELERLKKERILYSDWLLARFFIVYGAAKNEPPPQVDDLLELCREKRLDLVVLAHKFPGLYAATNGRLFLYDCRTIREKSLATVQRETPCGLQ